MASSVFYRFASRKDESRVTFDGTGISIFDLKREIILAASAAGVAVAFGSPVGGVLFSIEVSTLTGGIPGRSSFPIGNEPRL